MKKWGKRILLGGTALLAVLIGLIGWGLSAKPKSIPLPQPNGVDEIIRIAGALPEMPTGPDHSDAPESEIRAWIAATPNLRSDITNALRKDFLVRNTYSNSTVHLMMGLRSLERRLLAESRDETKSAADRMEIYLQAYELGCRATKGGALIDGLVSVAVRINSLKALSICSSNATSPQLKLVAVKLTRLISQAPTTKDYVDGEAFFASTVPLKAKLESWFDDIRGVGMGALFGDVHTSFKQRRDEMNRIEASTVRDLVVRSYTQDKGSAPTGWSDLIPAYLPAPLVDPVGKTNLSLIPGTTYKLSSM